MANIDDFYPSKFLRASDLKGKEDTDAWMGKQVRLYPDMEEFKGQVHEVVRVRRAPKPIGEDLNDEMPL